MPKISVVLISYNEKDYIENAINSIVKQEFAYYAGRGVNLEIIIGDDGSDDGSLELIEKIEKNDELLDRLNGTIQHFVMDRPSIETPIIPSLRVSNVIKRGLSLATGDYVVCMSADDSFCDVLKFDNALHFLESNPNYAAYVSGYRKVGLEEMDILPHTKSSVIYWSGYYLHLSCFVFRRFDGSLLLNRFCDDTGLEYVLAKHGKWKFDSTITFDYNQRDGSIMHSSKELELALMEVMLYQDILNQSSSISLMLASRARMYRPVRKCFLYRDLLTDSSYEKYILSCSQFDHNLIAEILQYNSSNSIRKLSFRLHLLHMKLLFYLFVVIRRLEKRISK